MQEPAGELHIDVKMEPVSGFEHEKTFALKDVEMIEPTLKPEVLINEKKSCEKDSKKSEAAKKIPKPAFNLTRFFKPMQPEEKEKLLLSELAKVQQELKARQQMSSQSAIEINEPAPVAKPCSQRTLQFKMTSNIVETMGLKGSPSILEPRAGFPGSMFENNAPQKIPATSEPITKKQSGKPSSNA